MIMMLTNVPVTYTCTQTNAKSKKQEKRTGPGYASVLCIFLHTHHTAPWFCDHPEASGPCAVCTGHFAINCPLVCFFLLRSFCFFVFSLFLSLFQCFFVCFFSFLCSRFLCVFCFFLSFFLFFDYYFFIIYSFFFACLFSFIVFLFSLIHFYFFSFYLFFFLSMFVRFFDCVFFY